MFFLKQINYLLFFLVLSSNVVVCQENLQQASVLNELYIEQISQLDKLVEILQTIGLQSNKFKLNSEQRNEVKKWILDYQKFINEINKNHEQEITQEKIIALAQVINNVTTSIASAFDCNYTKLSDLSTLTNRSYIEIDESLKDTYDRVKKNHTQLRIISERTDNIGLTRLNLAFRQLEKFNQEHKLQTKLKYSLAIGAGALAVLYYNDEQNLHPALKKIKNLVGRRETQTIDSKDVVKRFGLVGNVEAAASKISNLAKENPILIGAMLTPFSEKIARWVKGIYNDSTTFVEKKWKQTINTLHGGNIAANVQSGERAITLDDPKLVGLESQKEELSEIVHYFQNPAVYDRTKIAINKGILLIGDSGCGKTLAAKALCGSINQVLREKGSKINVEFREVRHSEVNWADNGLTKLIEEQQQKGPAILVFDEIHLSGLQIEHWNGGTLHSFLTAMSGLSSNNDNGKNPVILVAATNRPDLLDPALRRPGRFGTIIRFEKPNFEVRKQYFQVMFNEFAINTENINIDELAKHTQNCSYAQLEKIVSNARFKARTTARGISGTQDLLDIIDKLVRRINPETFPLSDSDKNIVAAHTAGQTLTRTLLNPKKKLLHATIKGVFPKIKDSFKFSESAKLIVDHAEKIKYGKIFKQKTSEFIENVDSEDQLKECKIYLAGQVAQKLLLNKIHEYRKTDKRKAFLLTQEIIKDGLKTEDLTSETIKINEQKTFESLKNFEVEIEKLLCDNLSSLNKIYEYLKENLSLDENQLTELVK